MEPNRVIRDHVSTTIWNIDHQYTTVEFSIKSLFLSTIKGSFAEFGGRITLDENDISRSSVEMAINTSSIDTGKRRRDDRLRSVDYLDSVASPEILFQSTSVARGRDRDTLRVTGTLTIKGQSRETVLDVMETDRSRSPQGEEVAYYTALAEIDRYAFGINGARWLMGRNFKVTVQVQASRHG